MQHIQISCLGLNHRSATIDVREKLLLTLPALLQKLPHFNAAIQPASRTLATIQETAVLSTCNRFEIYLVSTAPNLDLAAVCRALYPPQLHQQDDFASAWYRLQGQAALKHLCQVAAGLDSQVLGEPQILGQVQNALASAQAVNAAGPALTTLFQTAVRAGKRARSETAISQHPATISSVAIKLAQQQTDQFEQCHFALVGLGEMGQLSLKALQKRQIKRISLVNRSRERAQAFASANNYPVYSLTALETVLQTADIVFTATGATKPLITLPQVERAMARRNGRSLIFIDLAVPRNVSSDIGQLPNVTLFDMDNLRSHLDEAYDARTREIPKVQTIIADEIGRWQAEKQAAQINPLLTQMRQQAEAIRQQELERTLRHLDSVDPQVAQHIQHLSRSLTNKLLHNPTMWLRNKAQDEQFPRVESTMREIFGLPKEN